jgi:hypothetical protein
MEGKRRQAGEKYCLAGTPPPEGVWTCYKRSGLIGFLLSGRALFDVGNQGCETGTAMKRGK